MGADMDSMVNGSESAGEGGNQFKLDNAIKIVNAIKNIDKDKNFEDPLRRRLLGLSYKCAEGARFFSA